MIVAGSHSHKGHTSLTEQDGTARHNPLFTKPSILKILLILSNLSVCNPMFFRPNKPNTPNKLYESEHLQEPRNAGSRTEAPFFYSLLIR
jgi:hypothetical protein